MLKKFLRITAYTGAIVCFVAVTVLSLMYIEKLIVTVKKKAEQIYSETRKKSSDFPNVFFADNS